jgi:frataxin
MPDAENPAPKESESQDLPSTPTELSMDEFHERADAYLNELVERLEEAQENDPQIEVEYSVCKTTPNASLLLDG